MCGESLLFVGIYILARIWSSGECRSEVWQERSASHKYKTCKKKFWRAKNLRRRRAWTRQHSLLFEFIQCSWKVLNWCFLCDRVSVTQMAVSQGCTIQLGESANCGPDIFYSWQENWKDFSSMGALSNKFNDLYFCGKLLCNQTCFLQMHPIFISNHDWLGWAF